MAVKKAMELKYPNLYRRNPKNIGYHTNKQTRPILWGELIEAVATRSVMIFSEKGLKEFYNVQKEPKTGKIVSSMHDDYPTACGIAWQMRNFAFQSRLNNPEDALGRKRRRRSSRYLWS